MRRILNWKLWKLSTKQKDGCRSREGEELPEILFWGEISTFLKSCYEWLFCTCLESAGVTNNSSFKCLPAPWDELSQASIGQVSATPQVQRAQRATASGQHTGYNIIVFDLQVRQKHLLSTQCAAFAAHQPVPRGTFGRFRPALMCNTTLVVCCSWFRCYDLYTSVWAM